MRNGEQHGDSIEVIILGIEPHSSCKILEETETDANDIAYEKSTTDNL